MIISMTIKDFFSETATNYINMQDVVNNVGIEDAYCIPMFIEEEIDEDLKKILQTKFPEVEIKDKVFGEIKNKIEVEIAKLQGNRLAIFMFSDFFENFEEWIMCETNEITGINVYFSDGKHLINASGIYELETKQRVSLKIDFKNLLNIKIPLENITEIIFDIKKRVKGMSLKNIKNHISKLVLKERMSYFLENYLNNRAEINYEMEIDFNSYVSYEEYNFFLMEDISDEKLREIVYNTQ